MRPYLSQCIPTLQLYLSQPAYKHIATLLVSALLVLLAIFLRLPYIYGSEYTADESAFLLMARSITEGNLPYVSLFDMKPPLGFAILATFMSVTDTIAGMRFAVTLYLAAGACMILAIFKRENHMLAGFTAGSLFLVYASLKTSEGHLITTEHLTTLPVIVWLYIALKPQHSVRDYFWMGLLIAIASLIRTNLAVLCFAMPFIALAQYPRKPLWCLRALIWAAMGALLPYFLLVALYAMAGHLELLIRSIIVVPYHYVTGNQPIEKILESDFIPRRFEASLTYYLNGGGKWASIFAAIGGMSLVFKYRLRVLLRLIVALAAIMLSIFLSRRGYPHYWIQAMPVLAVLAGYGCMYVFRHGIASLLLLALLYTQSPYRNAIDKAWNTAPKLKQLAHRDSYHSIAHYLRTRGIEGKPILACNANIIYFLSKAEIPLYFAFYYEVFLHHTSKGLYGNSANPHRYFQEALAKEPVYIISNPLRNSSGNSSGNRYNCLRYLQPELTREYQLERTIGGMQLYRRKSLAN